MQAARIRETATRAWVLVQADKGKARDVAKTIWADLNAHLQAQYPDAYNFAVRADVIAGPVDFNIVVPVDVESSDVLNEVKRWFERQGLETVAVQVVDPNKDHEPYPPHDAYGYVTLPEADATKKRYPAIAGPRGMSPGENPWG